MAALAQGTILDAADGIMPDCNAAPGMAGIDQTRLGGPTAGGLPCRSA